MQARQALVYMEKLPRHNVDLYCTGFDLIIAEMVDGLVLIWNK